MEGSKSTTVQTDGKTSREVNLPQFRQDNRGTETFAVQTLFLDFVKKDYAVYLFLNLPLVSLQKAIYCRSTTGLCVDHCLT